MEIPRSNYLKQIQKFMDKSPIKVITGMRRCGKSIFLRQVIELIKKKNQIAQVIYIDMEDIAHKDITNYEDLDKYIEKKIDKRKKTYLLIDEVQNIQDWEKAIASYHKSKKFDIYITGSNSNLLSSELATLIAGRYVEFNIYSLSFNEFIELRKRHQPKTKLDIKKEFQNYLEFGGLPGFHELELESSNIYKFISAIYSTIVLKDIVSRYDIRNVRILQNTYDFILDNLGNICSAKKIADYFKSQQVKVSVDTILNYLFFLESSLLCHKVKRFDIKGKKLLEVQEKYFVNDLGLRNSLLGYKHQDISGLLENIVFLHLKMAGYDVSIGKLDETKIDFIATKNKEKKYIQVCYYLSDKEVEEREFSPLLKIKDAFPKYVLSMDDLWGEQYEGIHRLNIIDFLREIF